MKKTHIFCLWALISFSFQSCLRDSCKEEFTYSKYTPVYSKIEDIRNSIIITAPTDIYFPGKIYYKAPFLFINEKDKGIHIFDNSDPSNPVNLSFIQIPGNRDIAVKGNILYADCCIDLLSFDISNPANPVLVNTLQNILPNRIYENGFEADSSKGIVTSWLKTDTTVISECTNNQNIFWIENTAIQFDGTMGETTSNSTGTQTTGIAGSTAQFTISENYLYCLQSGALQLFDISAATSPVFSGDVNMGWNVETIFPYNEYLFIGSTTGVSIYSNSNPASPEYISTFNHITSCDPVVVSGNFAYSTLRSGGPCSGFTNQLDIIDISTISNPTLYKTYTMTYPSGLGIDNNYLFICDGDDGLKMYDVTDPLNILLLQTISIEGLNDVIPINGLLIVTGQYGIYQYDYSSGSLVPYSQISILKI